MAIFGIYAGGDRCCEGGRSSGVGGQNFPRKLDSKFIAVASKVSIGLRAQLNGELHHINRKCVWCGTKIGKVVYSP